MKQPTPAITPNDFDSSSQPILEAINLQKHEALRPRQSVHAVEDTSLPLYPGRATALVGESGSGKTTVARMLAGLYTPTSGTLRFRGQPIRLLDKRVLDGYRRHVQLILQDPFSSLNPVHDVRYHLARPLHIHKHVHSKAQETEQVLSLLNRVNLSPAEQFIQKFPHQLSGGQARRVGVARALALNPSLLVADEPTAGLDMSVQGEVLNLLGDLRERFGLAMLIITHNLHVARHIADQISIMYLGKIVEQGDAESIFAAPRHPYSGALLSTGPERDPVRRERRLKLHGEVPTLRARPSGCEFHTRCPVARPFCIAHPPGLSRETGTDYMCHFPLPQRR